MPCSTLQQGTKLLAPASRLRVSNRQPFSPLFPAFSSLAYHYQINCTEKDVQVERQTLARRASAPRSARVCEGGARRLAAESSATDVYEVGKAQRHFLARRQQRTDPARRAHTRAMLVFCCFFARLRASRSSWFASDLNPGLCSPLHTSLSVSGRVHPHRTDATSIETQSPTEWRAARGGFVGKSRDHSESRSPSLFPSSTSLLPFCVLQLSETLLGGAIKLTLSPAPRQLALAATSSLDSPCPPPLHSDSAGPPSPLPPTTPSSQLPSPSSYPLTRRALFSQRFVTCFCASHHIPATATVRRVYNRSLSRQTHRFLPGTVSVTLASSPRSTAPTPPAPPPRLSFPDST